MDFRLSEEQRLLKESVDRLVGEHYGFAERARAAREPKGWSAAIWSRFAELGLLGLPFAEGDGGFGAGAVETMIVMEAIGRGLLLEPYLSTVVLGGGLLRHAGSATQRAALVPRIAAGELRLAFAQMERDSRYDLAAVRTKAAQSSGGWRLDGAKSLVLHGDSADRLIVSARVSGALGDRDGIGLFLVDATATGLTRHGYPTQDGLRAAEVTLDGVAAEALGDPEAGLPAIERVADEAIAALCAEATGAMEAAHALTLDYLKTRRQFGRAIGEFQALQHRAVDMYILVEQARSMELYATMMASEDDAAARHRAVAGAKVLVGRAGRRLGQEAVQLHGGIGMTMEYAIGHYFKRLTAIDLAFGDSAHHLAQMAGRGGFLEERLEAATAAG